jgi:Zn-dependent protease with chaperone function
MGAWKVVRAWALTVCGVWVGAGCSTLPAAPGGNNQALAQRAADETVAKLTAGIEVGAVRVRVTGSARVGAFSGPDGSSELTSGLVERLDEDEIAAAVAHELGHVLGGRNGGTSSALDGRPGATTDDAEVRADRFATRLLARAGYTPAAMGRTLAKVMQSPGMTPAIRARLAKRIALLDSPD